MHFHGYHDAPAAVSGLPRIRIKCRDSTRGQPGPHRIRSRRQDDRHPSAEHDAGRIRTGQERQVLGEHVARLEIRHDQDLARPATADRIPFILAASRSMALSKASGPSRTPPVIWPRSAILHSAAASIVDGILDVTVSTADKIATRGVPEPDLREEIDGVLDDVALHIEIGKYVDRGIGDEQRLGMGRHVHDEDMADAPCGPQPGRRGGHGAHQFVRVQAALHQQLTLDACISSTAFAAAASLCGTSISSKAADIQLAVLGCAG